MRIHINMFIVQLVVAHIYLIYLCDISLSGIGSNPTFESTECESCKHKNSTGGSGKRVCLQLYIYMHWHRHICLVGSSIYNGHLDFELIYVFLLSYFSLHICFKSVSACVIWRCCCFSTDDLQNIFWIQLVKLNCVYI